LRHWCDLSFRKLLPALFMAFAHEHIRPDTRIIATGRQAMSVDAFREQATARSRAVPNVWRITSAAGGATARAPLTLC